MLSATTLVEAATAHAAFCSSIWWQYCKATIASAFWSLEHGELEDVESHRGLSVTPQYEKLHHCVLEYSRCSSKATLFSRIWRSLFVHHCRPPYTEPILLHETKKKCLRLEMRYGKQNWHLVIYFIFSLYDYNAHDTYPAVASQILLRRWLVTNERAGAHSTLRMLRAAGTWLSFVHSVFMMNKGGHGPEPV